MMISIYIYNEMIPYHFTVDWYYFYHTGIFHDFTTKYKIKRHLCGIVIHYDQMEVQLGDNELISEQ